MSLRDLLATCTPGPGYHAPRCTGRPDAGSAVEVDYDEHISHGGGRERPPKIQDLVLAAVLRLRIATTEQVTRVVAALPEVRLMGDMTEARILKALRCLQSRQPRPLVHWQPTVRAWTANKENDDK